MPQCKWQYAEDYVFEDHVTGLDFARDYLVRHPDFIHDCNRLGRLCKKRDLNGDERDAFVARWGLEYATAGMPMRWHPSVCPAALILIAAFAGSLIGAALELPDPSLAAQSPLSLLHLDRDPPDRFDGLAVVVPLDTLVDVRLAAVRALAAQLRESPASAFPPRLSVARRRRLILGLRALDAHLAGASYRQIATTLFGEAAFPASEWKTHDVRARTIRLVRDAMALMNGGYRRLLLLPYRGKLPPP